MKDIFFLFTLFLFLRANNLGFIRPRLSSAFLSYIITFSVMINKEVSIFKLLHLKTLVSPQGQSWGGRREGGVVDHCILHRYLCRTR